MYKKTIIILTNPDGGWAQINFESIESLPFKLENDNLVCFILSDSISMAELIKYPKPDYFVFHTSKQNDSGTKLNVTDPYFNNCKTISSSHVDIAGNFYKEILPKAFEKTLTLEDLEPFFQEKLSAALNILHDIYHGKDVSAIKTEYKSVMDDTKYSALIENLDISKFNYENDEHHQKLAGLRDDLIRLTLANQSS